MEIKAIKSYVHEIFHVDTGRSQFTVTRLENLLDGDISYDVKDNSRVFFGTIPRSDPLFRTIINAVEFRPSKA